MEILFKIIGHIGFISLKIEGTTRQKKGSHWQYTITGW